MTDIFSGMISTPRIAPVYVGGMPIEALNDALQDQADNLGSQKNVTENRFWASNGRLAADPTRDVFEIGLSSPQLVNFVEFEVARFPHRAFLQYFDVTLNDWVAVADSGGHGTTVTVNESLPAQIAPQAVNQGAPHPQHYGAGHWVAQSIALKPITASRFRLVMVRITTGQPPIDSFGNEVAYSLGVRNFALGYKVLDRSDVPRTVRHATNPREYEPFGSSTDPLGSTLEFSIRENRASDLLQGRGWKSGPQPISDAVVSLYVDARNALGSSQVIDRFYIEPTTVGPQLNLYYTNDEPAFSRAPALDEALVYPNVSTVGTGIVSDDYGLLFPASSPSAIDISNAAMHLDPNQPWWIGLVLQPQFASNDPALHTIFDAGTIRLDVSSGSFGFTIGLTTVTLLSTFDINETLSLVVGFDGVNKFIVVNENSNVTVALASAEVLAPFSTLRLGSRLGSLTTGAVRIQTLVLKQEPFTDPVDLGGRFTDAPKQFVLRTTYAGDDKGGSDNALLRYDPSFRTTGAGSINPYGLVGGEPDRYASLVWTPIHRDFRLRKGYLQFDPVRARYFKFEMTSLVAEPYDTLGPVVRQVKVFPPAVRAIPHRPTTTSSNNGTLSEVHSAVASSTIRYEDEQRLPYIDPNPTRPYSPTEGLHSLDPVIAERLRQMSLYYHVLPWQHDWKRVPRFPSIGQHTYEVLEVEHINRVAFFAGLNKISMYRLDYTAAHDTEQYLELFHDGANLASNTWVMGPNQISTATTGAGSAAFSQATSKIFNSTRKLRGVQFASQQTPASQMLTDPDFLDPSLLLWEPYGDVSELTINADFASDIGSTVLVQRGILDNFWSDIEARYANWDAIEQSSPDLLHPTYDDMQVAPGQFNYGGILGIEQVQPTSAGRVYAAARVYAERTLSAPLLLQIVSPDGTVLAESDVVPQGGQITEWFVGYTIGEGGVVTSLTWAGMEAIGTWAQVEALGSWDNAAQVTGVLDGAIQARLIQQGSTDDAWLVDNISIFDDPIVWEFSDDGGATFHAVYDIRNDPNGAYLFPDADSQSASVIRGTQLVYRVSGYRDGATVSGLYIRPLYTDHPLGRAAQETLQFSGPNQSPYDHYSVVSDDPRFKMWHKPIPEDWWFRFRRWLLLPVGTPAAKPTIVLPESIPSTDEGAPALTGTFLPETFYGGF